ncbi:hypothetical protein KJ762_00570 [bacterium]|nr:hypothetical protein [bacterium]MBU1632987.1 hypothetical protein [bacterium]MBU1875315.1 hypothetical protein [bacterium]
MPTEFKEFDYNDFFTVTDKDGVKYTGWIKSDDLLNPRLIIMPYSGRVGTLEDGRIFDSWKKSCNYNTLSPQQNNEIFECVYSIIRYFRTPANVRTKLYQKFRKLTKKKLDNRIKDYEKSIKAQKDFVSKIALENATRDRYYALIEAKAELLKGRSNKLKALPYVLIPLAAVLKKQGRARPAYAIIELINSLPKADFKATDKNIYGYLK